MSDLPSDVTVPKGAVICKLQDLENHQAKRFQIRCADITPFPGLYEDPEDLLPAFILRKDTNLVAYLNRCAHLPMEMDWNPGIFLDEEFSYIVCSTHYAVYDIATGHCLRGPCPKGAKLIPLGIRVEDDEIIFTGD